MSTDRDRLHTAQWVLERNLAWIAAAEVKVGVIVAIDTAMLGGLGAAFSAADGSARTHWAWFFSIATVICLGSGLFCAAMAVLPRISGPEKSLLFSVVWGSAMVLSTCETLGQQRMRTCSKTGQRRYIEMHRLHAISSLG